MKTNLFNDVSDLDQNVFWTHEHTLTHHRVTSFVALWLQEIVRETWSRFQWDDARWSLCID